MEKHDTAKESRSLRAPKQAPERHTEEGLEVLDPNPMQPPLGYKRTLSLHEQIAQQVRIAKLQLLDDMNLEETDEEADDFEVGDDYEPLSPYENDHIPSVKELKKRAKELNEKIREAQRKKAIEDYKKEEAGRQPEAPKAPQGKTDQKAPPE